MKTLTILFLCMLTTMPSNTQEQNIETQSVTLDDLISFVVTNYEVDNTEPKNITFLIQLKEDKLSGENQIILRQAFKLISKRINVESKLSIVAYSKFNGIALQPTLVTEEKLILHTLSDLKGSIAEFYEDGIALGYKHSEQNYDELYDNSVVIIRVNNKAKNEVVDIEKDEKRIKKKKKGNAVLVTALALLPELINLIKE